MGALLIISDFSHYSVIFSSASWSPQFIDSLFLKKLSTEGFCNRRPDPYFHYFSKKCHGSTLFHDTLKLVNHQEPHGRIQDICDNFNRFKTLKHISATSGLKNSPPSPTQTQTERENNLESLRSEEELHHSLGPCSCTISDVLPL